MSLALYPGEFPTIVMHSQSTTSLEGFCEWTQSPDFPEQGSISYIAGEVLIDMSPERGETHNKIKTKIVSTLDRYTTELKLGVLYGDGMRLVNKQANLSTEPDAMFATRETLKNGRFKGDGATLQESVDLIGTPDWVLEVVSPSSIRKDKKLLPERYFTAGITEYWLIDALGDEIEFTLYMPGEKSYVRSEPYNGWAYSPVFDREFQLTREYDEDEGWRYTLNIREAEQGA